MRILITTVTAGGGHLAAAAALEEAWTALRPADSLKKVDLTQFYSPLHRSLHANSYTKIVEHAPELWGVIFSKTDDPKVARQLNRIQRMLPTISRFRFIRFLKQFKPDAVLCTHYAPLELMDEWHRKLDSRRARKAKSSTNRQRTAKDVPKVLRPPLTVSIVTDFEAHALWMNPAVDLYCVAADRTKVRLVARGVDKKHIATTGIPVSSRFSARKSTARSIRKNLGLRDDMPAVLVLSGGFGMGPVGEMLEALNKLPTAAQITVVCGRNEKLRRGLAAKDWKHPTRILGFASNMHELMAAADLIVSKPGGLTSSEAMAMGKPLVILDPIPGQETANSDFLLEQGAAIKVNRVEDLPYRVEELLGSKKLAEMSRSARKIGRPKAAVSICEEVIARLAARKIPSDQ